MNTRKNKGITLIALIITIIVILILAGVSIMTLSGENGVINKAISSKSTSNRAEIKEQIDLAIMDLQMDGKEKNAENVKEDLIDSKAYSEEEIQVLSSSKIKIKGEEFLLFGDDSNEQPGGEPVEEPEEEPTLEDNVKLAREDLESRGETANTKSIKSYLVSENIYTEDQIQIVEKDDFIDILKVGEESVEVSTNRYTVYFEKPASWNASNVYAHIWYKNSSGNDISYASWPGTQINVESEGSNIYKCQLPECDEGYEWEKIIFNNGSGNPQTEDLEIGVKGQIFRIPTNIIYAKRIGHFTDPLKIYAWKTDGTKNADWSGVVMDTIQDSNGNTIYYYNMEVAEGNGNWDYFIINDGNLQTENIEYNSEKSNRIYCVRDEWVSGANPPLLKETSDSAWYGQWSTR